MYLGLHFPHCHYKEKHTQVNTISNELIFYFAIFAVMYWYLIILFSKQNGDQLLPFQHLQSHHCSREYLLRLIVQGYTFLNMLKAV